MFSCLMILTDAYFAICRRIPNNRPLPDLGDRLGLTACAPVAAAGEADATGGVILRGQRAVIDWRALGYEVEVSLRITLDKTQIPAPLTSSSPPRAKSPRCWKSRPSSGQCRCAPLGDCAGHGALSAAFTAASILTLPHITDIEALMHGGAGSNQTKALPI